MHPRARRPIAVAFPVAFVLAVALPAWSRANAKDLLGTYRLQGRSWIHARPFPAREDDLHADAVLSPGAAQGEVRMRLAGQGAACELTATLDGAGALTVPAGQRCPVDLASDRAEGQAEARVVSGSGRIRGDVLHLELTLSLTGSVRFRSGPGALGKVLSLPGSRGPPIAFEGEARGRAAGRRDRSRAAQ